MSRLEAENYNKEAIQTIWNLANGISYPSSHRVGLVYGYLSVVLEHHEAIGVLLQNGLPGSAFALLRSQIEAAFRGLWVNLIATEKEVEQIVSKDKAPFPKFHTLSRLLDRSYKAYGVFSHIAQHWSVLNSFTHTGMAQISRRYNAQGETNVNYAPAEIEELLRFSASVSILSFIPIFRCAGLPEKAEALEAWLNTQPYPSQNRT